MTSPDFEPHARNIEALVANFTQGFLFVRQIIDLKISSNSDMDKLLAAKLTENAANKRLMDMYDYDSLLNVKSVFDNLLISIPVGVALDEVISRDPAILDKHSADILRFGQQYLALGDTPAAGILLSAVIRNNSTAVTKDQILTFLEALKGTDLDSVYLMTSSAIVSHVEGIDAQNVRSWVEAFVIDVPQGKPGRWDLYHKLALAVVHARQVDENGRLLKQAIPGIPEAEEARLIDDWYTKLDLAGESALALDLYWAAYQKAVTGTTVEGVQAYIEAALGQSGGGFVQTGYGAGTEVKGEVKPDLAIEIAAAFIQKHGDLLTPDTIFEWNDQTTVKVASITNSEKIIVAALQNEALRKRLNLAKLASVVQGCIDLAVARRTPAFYVEAARVAAAAVETGFAGKDQANAWVAEHKEYGALCEAQPLLLAMWQRRQEFNLPPTLLQVEMKEFISKGNYDGALKFAQAALAQGAPLERASILDLAARIGAGNPVKAVELCLSARDFGVDVPEEMIQQWHSACYDGKPPEEAANNAIALLEVYRSRPLVQRMTEAERAALEQEIRDSFAKVMQHREALGITVSTPYAEAVEKIASVLYPGA